MTPPAAAAAPAVDPRRTVAPGRPRTAPARPRRVSGPARRRIDTRAPRVPERHADAETGIAVGILATLGSLSRHSLLDRLLGGRTWIALVAFALIGIVTLQLGLLELNASIGRTLQQEAALQRENASLSIENSELAAGDRVEMRAEKLGMGLVRAGALHFLVARPRIDAVRGAAALSAPLQARSTGSEEAAPGVSAAASAPAASPSGEQSATTTASPQPSAESPSAPAGETSAGAGASTGASASVTSSSTTPSSTTSSATPPSPAQPAGSGSAEASPAGGT
ncbi:MAG TPA: hypothetical protein VES97_07495, partial [Solirubrobacteraceae bacterium]|nr:hypothetical protein [Solirubrobacteraceae bacterium]